MNKAVQGYNCSVVCYGGKDSGKTHTMLGSQDDPGVLPRSIQDLLRYKSNLKQEMDLSIWVSYFEIDGDKVNDLLIVGSMDMPRKEMKLQGTIIRGIKVV